MAPYTSQIKVDRQNTKIRTKNKNK